MTQNVLLHSNIDVAIVDVNIISILDQFSDRLLQKCALFFHLFKSLFFCVIFTFTYYFILFCASNSTHCTTHFLIILVRSPNFYYDTLSPFFNKFYVFFSFLVQTIIILFHILYYLVYCSSFSNSVKLNSHFYLYDLFEIGDKKKRDLFKCLLSRSIHYTRR